MADNNKSVEDIGVVYIADPNLILAENDGIINGTLPYEDLRPYVELTCIRRKEGNFFVNPNGTYIYDDKSSTEKINFMGFDHETKQYTVNYTDDIVGSVDERTSNEGFGIRDIQITQNANHMPIVNITFVDVKGASLYAQGEDSPYAALHDYPPPIYNLKMKGAFGKFVEFDLHRTDSNIEFDSITGDMLIKCSFIGQYFGVLTDILIGYLKAVPYLTDSKEQVMGKNDHEANSFFELTLRGDLLYTKIDDYKATSPKLVEKSQLETGKREIEELKVWVNDHFTNINTIKEGLVESGNFNDLVVTVDGGFDSKKGDYFVTYTIPTTRTGDGLGDAVDAMRPFALSSYAYGIIRKLNQMFPKFPREGSGKDTIKFMEAIIVIQNSNDNIQGREYIVSINMKRLVTELKSIEQKLTFKLTESLKDINKNLSDITSSILGLTPSIGEIFRIICGDVDKFLGKLKAAGDVPKNYTPPTDNNPVVSMVPFPTVIEKRAINGDANKMQDVFVYPGVYKDFRNWGECEFVELYCKSLTEQQKMVEMVEHMVNQVDRTKYYPLSPIEDNFSASGFLNEYVLKTEPYDILKVAAMRYIVSRDYTFRGLFDTLEVNEVPLMDFITAKLEFFSPAQKKRFIRATGKVEGANAFHGISNHKTVEYIEKMDTSKVIELLKRDASLKKDHNRLLDINYNQSNIKFREKLDLYTKATSYDDVYNKFSGIKAITDDSDATYRFMLTPKTITSETIDGDRDAVLDDYGSIIGNWFNPNGKSAISDANERAVITEANTFLFKDSKREPDSFKSDFFASNDMIKSLLINRIFKYTDKIKTREEHQLLTDKGSRTDKEFKEDFFKGLTDNLVFKNHNDFSIYGKFIIPAVIEMPKIYAIWLGYKLGLVEHEGIEVLTSGGELKTNVGQLDTNDRALSETDRLKLKELYDEFDLNSILAEITARSVNKNEYFGKNTVGVYLNLDKYSDTSSHFFSEFPTIKDLISPVYIVNTSSQTFLPKRLQGSSSGFRSLFRDGSYSVKRKSLNTIGDPKGYDNSFEEYMGGFLEQFKKMSKELTALSKNKEDEIRSKINDVDFKTNLYYNFKMIYDRWIAGNSWPGEGLFDRFSFVTRSMQNISDDAIIDFSTLIDDSKSEDTSVFTAIAKVLQENNFSFFPLTSYIELQQGNAKDKWKESFQINNSLNEGNIAKPKFVCMYIGGYSNNLNLNNKDYPDDSVTFGLNQPDEFKILNGEAVFAFKARVGSQNQTVFSDFKINTSEFKATDESLRIEDKILTTTQNSNPIRKSQNLMNVYSQRSYSCGMTIPFGNMTIQPTQYFQLEGVPIFNGAYMIYEVEHSLTAGSTKVVTTFKGNRINRYAFPIVTEYTLNYLGISSEFSEGRSSTSTTSNSIGAIKHGSANVDIKLEQSTINNIKNIRFKGI